MLTITVAGSEVLARPLRDLRLWWESTSTAIAKLQADEEHAEAEHRSHLNARPIKYRLTFSPPSPAIVRDQPPKVAVIREEGSNGDRELAAAFYRAGFEPLDMNMEDILSDEVRTLDEVRGIAFPGGFAYADVLGSAKGWAGPLLFNPRVKAMFDRFYARPDTFSFGPCNGCQLMSYLGWLPYAGIPEGSQPRLVHNRSRKFESRWVGVRIVESPSIMLAGMEGSVLGVHVAHGEGQWLFPDEGVATRIREDRLAPLVYVDPDGNTTEEYPYNPNGSPLGWAGICSSDGRHLAVMPHPERCFLPWQWPWMPEEFRHLEESPWLKMFKNAADWCRKN